MNPPERPRLLQSHPSIGRDEPDAIVRTDAQGRRALFEERGLLP